MEETDVVVDALLQVRDVELAALREEIEEDAKVMRALRRHRDDAEQALADARATLRAVRLAARQWAAVDRPLVPLACAGDEPVYAAAGRYILGLLRDVAFLKALDERDVLPGDSREGFGTVEDGFGGVWARCSRDCVLAVVRPGKVQCAGDRCDESGSVQHARD